MYVPENVVTNDDLSKIMDTSSEWIIERTGIKVDQIVTIISTEEGECQVIIKNDLSKYFNLLKEYIHEYEEQNSNGI